MYILYGIFITTSSLSVKISKGRSIQGIVFEACTQAVTLNKTGCNQMGTDQTKAQ